MTDPGDWIRARRPPPPPDLQAGLSSLETEGDTLAQGLTTAARARLDEARARTGRVRDSAFRLLEADALLTYACEAALESDEPAAALARILAELGA